MSAARRHSRLCALRRFQTVFHGTFGITQVDFANGRLSQRDVLVHASRGQRGQRGHRGHRIEFIDPGKTKAATERAYGRAFANGLL